MKPEVNNLGVLGHFDSKAKGSLSNFIPILYTESCMLCKKTIYNDLSLEYSLSFPTKSIINVFTFF